MAGYYEQQVQAAIDAGGLCAICPDAVRALGEAVEADDRGQAPPLDGPDWFAAILETRTLGATMMLKNGPCEAVSTQDPAPAACERSTRFKEAVARAFKLSGEERKQALIEVGFVPLVLDEEEAAHNSESSVDQD